MPSENLQRLLAALGAYGCEPKPSGPGRWAARCPAHDDSRPSLSIAEGDDGRALLRCHAGCPTESVVAALGLGMGDLMPPSGSNGRPGSHHDEPKAKPATASNGRVFTTARDAVTELERRLGKRAALWTYRDAQGEPVGVIVRWNTPHGKEIRPVSKHPDGWRIGAMPEPRPLYNLPAIVVAGAETPIVVCEGEKAADAARRCGLVATTSAGGAKAAGKTDWTALRGRRVVILPDADSAGEAYALDVARLALAAGAHDVRILELADFAPELPEGGDLADVVQSPTWCGLPFGDAATPEDVGRWILATAENIKPWRPEPADEPLLWKPYPTDALPEPFRVFVETAARAIGCDTSYVALPLLVAAAAAIGTTRRLEPRAGWRVPSILWGAVVGESGTHKTPAIAAALRWTQRHQAALLADYENERSRFETELLSYEKALSEWKRDKADGLPPAKPKAPVARRVLVQDITIEALAPILKANLRGVLLGRDELAGWLGSFDRYANTQGGDAPFWVSAFNGQPTVIDRKNCGTLYVPTAAVSIVGGIQPGVLRRALGQQHRENGLAARLLLVMPPRRAKRWTEASIEPAVSDAMGRVFERLFGLEHDVGDNAEPMPRLMRLSPDAKAAYIKFFDGHGQDSVDATGDWAAALAKLEELPLRLGLVLHLIRWAAGEPINPDVVDFDSITRAIRLTEWHKHESQRVYTILDGGEAADERRQLVEWIERHDGAVTVRDVTHGVWRFRGKPDEAEAALGELVKAGLGAWEDVPADKRGGRPTRVFRLSHQHHHHQNPRNRREREGFGDGDAGDAPDTPPPEPEPANPKPPERGDSLWGDTPREREANRRFAEAAEGQTQWTATPS